MYCGTDNETKYGLPQKHEICQIDKSYLTFIQLDRAR